MRLKRLFAPILVLIILASPIVAAANAQSIDDWWKLRNYIPPASIVQLATQDTMNSYTRHLFYLNHPQLINNAATFRSPGYCPENLNTIVLGCYHQGQNGIFIYQVSDPQLAGVVQVTAAHEVLHAVYARLSSSARNQLNSELESYYKNGLTDSRVIDEVKLYQQTEPNDVYDEMSCTFGTEIPNLPAPLENYYKQYFTNRAVITNFAQSYQSEFTSRQDQASLLSTQMSALLSKIDNEEGQLNAELNQINSDRARLDSERSDGQIATYNSDVASFNSEVNSYNAGIASLKTDITSYNQLVSQYNAIAQELATLEKSIDTRLVPQTQ